MQCVYRLTIPPQHVGGTGDSFMAVDGTYPVPQDKSYERYLLNGKTYYVPITGYSVQIMDFDFATTPVQMPR